MFCNLGGPGVESKSKASSNSSTIGTRVRHHMMVQCRRVAPQSELRLVVWNNLAQHVPEIGKVQTASRHKPLMSASSIAP